ncbi:hypothetical protein ACEPAH_8624 [Sanghuangporus vaninii]
MCSRGSKCQRPARRARLPSQLVRDLLGQHFARQAALKPQNEPNRRPLLTFDKGSNPNTSSAANSGATNAQAGTQPTVPLPHGLGIITIPQGAQRLDVRFNCVTNKLPSGQLTDSLVVNVDVIYNPGCGPNGTKIPTQVSVKSEA